MKHKRNLIYIFLASAIISVLLVFVNQDVVVRGLFDKIMEAVIMTALIYIVLIVLYFLMFIAKSGANRIARKQKKDLTK